MFNLERELEFAGSTDYRLREILSHDDEWINTRCDGPHGVVEFQFSRKTGVLRHHEEADHGIFRLREKSEMQPTSHFFLHAGQREWPKGQWVKCAFEDHPNGAAAAQRMKEHNEKAAQTDSPFRFIVKKEVELSPVRDYAKWAEERFATGEWNQVPWASELSPIAYHFAHISVSDDTKVAFWESEANAQLDYVTIMSPGRYLQQYFGDQLTNEQIRDWAVKVDMVSELHFATEPQDIVDIYVACGQGCMRYADHKPCYSGDIWKSGLNPTRVYGAGDLAMAYIKRRDKVIARALCWPAKKAVGRIYGDIERMKDVFASQGWEFDSTSHGAEGIGKGLLEGARILKLRPEGMPDNFMMPYLDYGYRVKLGDDFNYLTRGHGESSGRTDGLLWEPGDEGCVNDEDTFDCARCGDTEDYDDHYTVGDDWWCYSCYEDHASTCVYCGNLHPDHNFTYTQDGDAYCSNHQHLITSCDYCSEYVPNDQIAAVHDARTGDVHTDACRSCVDTHSDIQETHDGTLIDTDTAQQCEGCHTWFSRDLEENECPNQTCVEARAEETVE